MSRVVSFTRISLQENLLSQAVCRQIHTFDPVRSLQERMCCLTCEVLNDTNRHHILHTLPAFRVMHDLAVCDGAVLPVDFPVVVCVFCDDHAHGRKITLDAFVLQCPHRAAQSKISKRISFFVHRDSRRRRHSQVIILLRVAVQACAECVIGNECVHSFILSVRA